METTLHLPQAFMQLLQDCSSLQPHACKGTAFCQATHMPNALPPHPLQTLAFHCRIRSLALMPGAMHPRSPCRAQEREPLRLRVL